MSEDPTRLSRPASSSPFGKLDRDMKFLLDEETCEALAGLACVAGMSVSEYLRELVYERVHGGLKLLRLRSGRTGAMPGTGG